MVEKQQPSDESPRRASDVGMTNEQVAHGVRLFARLAQTTAESGALFPRGTAGRVYPLLLFGCATAIELYGQQRMHVPFHQLIELSRAEASLRKKNDYWKTPNSVLQAYYRFLKMHPTCAFEVDGAHLRYFFRFEKEEGRDVLCVTVTMWVRHKDGEKREVQLNGKPVSVYSLPLDVFFWHDTPYMIARALQEIVLRGQAGLATRLFDQPSRLLSGQRIEFMSLTPDIATAVDWGDGTRAAVSGGRITHAYRRPGAYTITVYRKGSSARVVPNAVIVADVRKESLADVERTYRSTSDKARRMAKKRETKGTP